MAGRIGQSEMAKIFNIYGSCIPGLHYMVDLKSRLARIRAMVDAGQYFTINKARQYGKTTILQALARDLKDAYIVVSMDFQRMSTAKFTDENVFSVAFAQYLIKQMQSDALMDGKILEPLKSALERNSNQIGLYELFGYLADLCANTDRPVVLLIDEIDTAANNQVFLDFLAQLRTGYLNRMEAPALHSVILAGVYDVRNIIRKVRPDEEHEQNSPWNIAAKFRVDMSFAASEIAGMLAEYEAEHHTGMNTGEVAGVVYDYTSGYPYLVSALCKYMDEELEGTEAFPDKKAAWTRAGVQEAVNRLLFEKNPLFDSLIGKLCDYPELKDMIYQLLFRGCTIAYNADDKATDMLLMFGFVKAESGTVQIANRIFETRLYNYFLTLPEVQGGDMYKLALRERNQFVRNGRLDMKRILEKFVAHFDEIYGDRDGKFLEEDGRRYFLLYLKPVINGTGNYYVEARTRNQERTDLIVDYLGEQFVIEMKIWRGNAYHERGEAQLTGYLDHYGLKKGYMLSFNFNREKKIGVKEIRLGDRVLIEAVV